MASFIPFGPLGGAQFEAEAYDSPIGALIMESRRREAEEKRKREEEERRKAAEAARATAAQLQSEANASGFPGVNDVQRRAPAPADPLAEVNQRLATQYATPDDMRQARLREAWGMREGQQKPTFGQRTSALLAEMVRGMAQGSKYKPIAERVDEQVARDYELQTARMGQLNAAERIQALTQKAQSYEAARAYEFEQKQKLEQQKLAQRMEIEKIKLGWQEKKLSSQEKFKEVELALRARGLTPTPQEVAAIVSGFALDVEKDADGNLRLVKPDVTKLDEYKKELAGIRDATQTLPPDRQITTENTIFIDTVNPETGQMEKREVRVPKSTTVRHMRRGGVEEPTSLVPKDFLKPQSGTPGTPTVPTTAPSSIPDVPAPPRRAPTEDFSDPNATLRRFPKLTPQESQALSTNQTALNDLSRAIQSTSGEYADWVKNGMQRDKGIGEFLQTPKVAGREIFRPGIELWNKWRVATAASDDPKEQEWVRRYNAILQPFEKAKVASMFGEGGKNLTGTERELVQKYWSNATEGPRALFRSQLMTAGMLRLGMYRMARKITPTEENSLNRELEAFVNDAITKLEKAPSKYNPDNFDPNVFVPRLMAAKEAARKTSPSPNTVLPPTLKKDASPTATKPVEEFQRKVKQKKEEGGFEVNGIRIRRVR